MARTKGAKDKQPRKPTGEVRGITKMQNPVLPEGYNTESVKFLMEITPDTELIDINDVAEMERRFQHYLECCIKYDKKPSNLNAYLAIGINKNQAYDWANVNTKMNPARTNFIKKVMKICAAYRENLMADGKINPVTGIFWQKNYDGLRDQQELVVQANNPIGDQKSAEELSQKYIEQTYDMQDALPYVAETPSVIDMIPNSPEKVAEG